MDTRAIRQRIADLHAFCSLRFGLYPAHGGTRTPQVTTTLNAVGDFIREASNEDVETRGRELEALLLRQATSGKVLRSRSSPEAVGRDFVALSKAHNVWRFGVTYGWLRERLQTPILGFPVDLPDHARIGLGIHAGSAAIEEATLVDDCFFLSALTEAAYEQMWRVRRSIGEPTTAGEAQAAHEALTPLNLNVGTLARLTVVTAAAFVESFVNSVGANEANQRGTADAIELEQLRGKRKGRFLRLETKLERFPALIRSDRVSPLRVVDESQRVEPFRRFLAETKLVRDASMHFAPDKAAIICTPQEWQSRARDAVADAVNVARSFWLACYPEASYPKYLYGLDEERFRKRALKRVSVTDPDRESRG